MATEATIVRHTLIVDASCDYGRRVVGVGIVVREARRPGRRGPVVDQLCEAYRYMRRQLKDAHKRGEGRDRHDLQGHILRLAAQFDEVKFAYQPRRKNQRKISQFLGRRRAAQPPPSASRIFKRRVRSTSLFMRA